MNLDECLKNIEKVGKKFAIANWPLDVVRSMHVRTLSSLVNLTPDGFKGTTQVLPK